MNFHFHPEAFQEYAEATQYYAGISTSLAIGFVSQVEEGINLILLYPQAWQPIEEDIRRLKVGRGHKNAFSPETINCFLEFIAAKPQGVNCHPTKWPVTDNSWKQEEE